MRLRHSDVTPSGVAVPGMALEDAAINLLIAWEAVSFLVPAIPPPSTLLRRRPRWVRYVFAGSLAGIVAVHLDCLTGASCEPT